MKKSETNATSENSLQTTLNDLDAIRMLNNPFWNTPVDFKVTTFDSFLGVSMKVYEDQLMLWAEDMGDRYGNKL
jgi:hypothetical protein